MPRRTNALKPSGYDVVIRNSLAIKAINAKLSKKAKPKDADALMTEKDRLIDEMQAACPHESILRCDDVRTTFGPEPVPTALCTSCGQYEQSPRKRFKTLKRGGKAVVKVNRQEFAVRLGKTLRFTGINVPSR